MAVYLPKSQSFLQMGVGLCGDPGIAVLSRVAEDLENGSDFVTVPCLQRLDSHVLVPVNRWTSATTFLAKVSFRSV